MMQKLTETTVWSEQTDKTAVENKDNNVENACEAALPTWRPLRDELVNLVMLSEFVFIFYYISTLSTTAVEKRVPQGSLGG